MHRKRTSFALATKRIQLPNGMCSARHNVIKIGSFFDLVDFDFSGFKINIKKEFKNLDLVHFDFSGFEVL